jgi:hypothetical protein
MGLALVESLYRMPWVELIEILGRYADIPPNQLG